MSYAPSVTVGDDASTMLNKPASQGGTIIESQSDGDLDAAVQQAGPATQRNPFEEVNLFIGEFGRIYQIAPFAAATRIQDILQSILTQSYRA